VALSLSAVLLLVFGVRLALGRLYAPQVPFLDAWSGEAIATFLPFGWGLLEWRDLFDPHYEHRIVLTRVLDLALLTINGQWDELVHSAVNAVLHGLAICTLILLLWSHERRRLELLCVAGTVVCILPFGWQNALAGFQSGFHLLVLTFLLPIALVPGAPWSSGRWWVGIVLLGLGLFSLASGVLSAVIVALAICLRRLFLSEQRRGWLVSATVCAAIVGVGVWMKEPVPDWHIPALARTVGDFSRLTFAQLAFPHIHTPWSAPAAWLPFLVLLAAMLWRRTTPSAHMILLTTLAAWVAGQAAMSGYARGGVMPVPPSRYLDLFSIGILINVSAAIALWGRLNTRGARVVASAGLAIWSAWMVLGLAERSEESLPDMALRRVWDERYVVNLRRFLAGLDVGTLAGLSYPGDLPFDDGAVLANVVLADPAFRKRLPPALHDPMVVAPSAATDAEVFVRGGAYPLTPVSPLRPSWGSYSGLGNPGRGMFFSTEMACARGAVMSVEVAGYLGREGTALFIEDLDQRKQIPIGVRRTPAETWVKSLVRCPAGRFTIVARDDTPDWWFAFRHPVELGGLSALVVAFANRWWMFIAVGGAAVWLAVRSRSDREPPVPSGLRQALL
jgi:hypothetical protein